MPPISVPTLPDEEASADRDFDPYNASVAEVVEVHPGLRILRIHPDQGPLVHEAGQYTVLGLWDSAPCVESAAGQFVAEGPAKVIKRAYSFSSRILDDDLQLIDPSTENPLEFYIALVAPRAGHPVGLTPRLFALAPDDRLMLGRRAFGSYTLAQVRPDDDVVFAATGTGEAPHNTMIAALLNRGHRGRIVALTCVRRLRDLAYLLAHRELERRFRNYRYVPLTTREPSNLDPAGRGYVGKRYLQDYLVSPQMTERLGRELRPGRLHVFVCGNPQMIGALRKLPDGSANWPAPRGVLETLAERGFQIAEYGQAGDVHYERYW